MGFVSQLLSGNPAPAPARTGVTPADPSLEALIHAKGLDLLNRARNNTKGMLSAAFWSDKLMEWSMKDEAFKVQLFRFVDAFPMLRTPDAVHE